jgi:hypothetical protein
MYVKLNTGKIVGLEAMGDEGIISKFARKEQTIIWKI